MATKLNSNALVNQSIEEEKLSTEVQQKLNQSGVPEAPIDTKRYCRKDGQWDEIPDGVEEAPIDNKAYIRKNASWEKYEYPPLEEPVIIEVINIGNNSIQVPPLCHHCAAFLVNGGNGGFDKNSSYDGHGGGGGYTTTVYFDVTPLDTMIVKIGEGGHVSGFLFARGELGEQTIITYNGNTYSPRIQDLLRTTYSQPAQDGVLNDLNPNDTNLYGACGGSDYIYMSKGGKTGGGNGNTYDSDQDGSFYGAGGGSNGSTISTGGAGYQGYAYLKFY